ncbi:MAG: hypothetical protein AABY01_00665 [Nanoarchaeota archaeon]
MGLGELFDLKDEKIPVKKSGKDWSLSPRDIGLTMGYLSFEYAHNVTKESLFERAIWAILSPMVLYKTQRRVNKALVMRGLTTPEAFLAHPKELEKELQSMNQHDQKYNYIMKFSKWWLESSIPDFMLACCKKNPGKEEEIAARDLFGEHAPGLAYKCASLMMASAGARHVVTIDRHILQYLHDHDVKLAGGKFGASNSVRFGKYQELEKIFSQHGEERYGLYPALYQAAIWCKATDWKPPVQRAQKSLFVH